MSFNIGDEITFVNHEAKRLFLLGDEDHPRHNLKIHHECFIHDIATVTYVDIDGSIRLDSHSDKNRVIFNEVKFFKKATIDDTEYANAVKYESGELTPSNDYEQMLVMAILRKARNQMIDVDRGDGIIGNSSSQGINLNMTYSKPKPNKLKIDWSVIDSQWNYASMDKSGDIFFYDKEPIRCIGHWSNDDGGDFTGSPLIHDTNGVDWYNSVVCRKQ
jgi:hypothetical protein